MEQLLKHTNGQWEILGKADHAPKSSHQDNAGSNALGISDDGGGKLKFDPGFGQKEFRKYVDQRADHIPDTGYGVGDIDDFNWHYDPEYETHKLTPIKGGADGWKNWFKGEMTEWVHDHGDERKGHFEKWAKNPHTKPAIVIEGIDGKIHIWDGHHRCAMAHVENMKTMPVIYGTRKSK